MIKNNRRLAGLQLQTQQPRLVAKVDFKQYFKTRVRKKDVVNAIEKVGYLVCPDR